MEENNLNIVKKKDVKLLLNAIGQANISLIITDMKGKIEFVNEGFQNLTGYTEEEVIGKNHNILNSDSTPKSVYEDLWNTVKSGKEWSGELLNKHKNGNLYWADLMITPLKDSKGNIVNLIGIERDITQRKIISQELVASSKTLQDTNEKLKDLDDYKNQLLGIAAHDLRNPLGRISLSSELLSDDNIGEKDKKKLLNVIVKTTKQMKELLNEILDLTKIESGKIKLKKSKVELDPFCENIIFENKITARKKNIKISYKNLSSFSEYCYDPKRIEQVLDNLISNAIKFSTKDTNVELILTNNEDKLVFTVKDEGPGVKEDEKNMLFQPFQICSNKPTAKENSSGLGLSICKKLIEIHGGKIWVESNLGEGSSFSFEI